MTDCLFLAPEAADLQAQPLIWHSPAQPPQALPLAELASRLGKRPLTLVLPGARVSGCSVQLPTRKARWLQQALRYAVEEHFAENIEQLHLALGDPLADGHQRVLAVNRAYLQRCLQQAAQAGLNLRAVHASHDLLPREHSCALLLADHGLLGGPAAQRLSFPLEDWPKLAQRQQALLLPDEQPYALRRATPRWSAWQPLLLMLGAWLLQLVFDAGQSWFLEQQGNRLQAASQTLYRQLFPDETRIVNLAAQFEQQLARAEQQPQGRFQARLQRAADAMRPTSLRITALDYDDASGQLVLQLHGQDFNELEQLRQQLSRAGADPRLDSASRNAQGVSARLIIGGDA